mmetsp:Transcript_10901/g.34938  ORF Transcript_10901/g.34938 Transcript_10901/m.34938 type:complete len:212 (+) Transcript_10901:28-663(+)
MSEREAHTHIRDARKYAPSARSTARPRRRGGERGSGYPEPTPVVGSLAATPAAAVVVRRRQEERRAHAGADGGHDHRERHLGGHLDAGEAAEQLESDEGEHECDAVHQVLEGVDRLGDEGVQLTQPEDGTRVGGEGEEGVGGHAEDSRHRVDGEDNVGELDADEGEQQRGGDARAVRGSREEVVAVVEVRRGQVAFGGLHDRVLRQVLLVV